MTRIAPPMLGYNNNVRYLGRTFHIQTEDSGTKYARIMTHLFIDGGRIVKTTKTEYGDIVGRADMGETVRRLMKEQHKNMFLSLRAGEFDSIIERVLNGGGGATSVVPTLSHIPKLRADSLPSLAFGAGEEPKTIPGLSSFVIDASASPESKREPAPVSMVSVVQERSGTAEGLRSGTAEGLRSSASLEPAPNSVAEARRVSEPRLDAVKRPSVRPRRAKSVAPASPRRALLIDDPTPADLPETTPTPVTNRPSERPSRSLAVRPPTPTQEAIDPRTQSIFGEAAAGRQTLDEVILSFLEDEDT